MGPPPVHRLSGGSIVAGVLLVATSVFATTPGPTWEVHRDHHCLAKIELPGSESAALRLVLGSHRVDAGYVTLYGFFSAPPARRDMPGKAVIRNGEIAYELHAGPRADQWVWSDWITRASPLWGLLASGSDVDVELSSATGALVAQSRLDGSPLTAAWRAVVSCRGTCRGLHGTLAEAYASADSVVLGRVLSAGPEDDEPITIHRPGQSDLLAVPPERFRARIEVLERFKGDGNEQVLVFEKGPLIEGGPRFHAGEQLLVFSNEGDSWPTACSGTRGVGPGGFEEGRAWLEALRAGSPQRAEELVKRWYLDGSCIARFRLGSWDEGYVRLAFHRIEDRRVRILVTADLPAALLPRFPAEIELALDGVVHRLPRPSEVWGSPPGDVMWGFESWALEARKDDPVWKRLANVEEITITVPRPGGGIHIRQSLPGDIFRQAWEAAGSCEPPPFLGTDFVFGP